MAYHQLLFAPIPTPPRPIAIPIGEQCRHYRWARCSPQMGKVGFEGAHLAQGNLLILSHSVKLDAT